MCIRDSFRSSLTLPQRGESRQQPTRMRPLIGTILRQTSRLALMSRIYLFNSRASAWVGSFCGF
eukprot:1374788-Pyramimonas_sp.AAC.1